MIARRKKAKVLALRSTKARDAETDQIDPVLGDFKTSPESSASGARSGRRQGLASGIVATPAKWDSSLLKKVVLDRNQIWYSAPPQYSSSQDAVSSNDLPFPPSVQPEHFSPLLTSETDRKFLLESLPIATANEAYEQAKDPRRRGEETEAEVIKQAERSEMLMRAMDLRNSDSRGIRVVNTERIVKAFGTATKRGAEESLNTGSSEVQAAILTHRIRLLADHLATNPRDVHNRKSLRGLVMKRAGLLKYFRRRAEKQNGVGETGYLELLDRLGLDRKAVEGELIVR